MPPTLYLSDGETPSIEFLRREIYPLVALLLEMGAPLKEHTHESVWAFVSLDTLRLDDRSREFFLMLERVCQEVIKGKISEFDIKLVEQSEFAGFLVALGDGKITDAVRSAAQRYLAFLTAHPQHWSNSEIE